MTDRTSGLDTAVVDIDGTLVDSSYHHVLAWHRAFAQAGVEVEAWDLHRHMGMGGDRLVAAVAGREVEESQGDEIRDHWQRAYTALLDEVRPLPRATALLAELDRLGLSVVLATSGHPSHTERTLEILGLKEDDYALVSSDEASSTKPSPELIIIAVDRVGGRRPVVIGDTVWDVEAAGRCGYPAIGLLTGGFSEPALYDAGAAVVEARPEDLLERLSKALEISAGTEEE